MKLLFIYDPPAVGKLTVANQVARLTGFKVFHNHLSIDAIEPVFGFGSQLFAKVISAEDAAKRIVEHFALSEVS